MRNLDGKFRVEGDQLVKISNGEVVPTDEPLFVVRARDALAVSALNGYLALCEANGCTDFQLGKTREAITRFEEFRQKFPERMKQPGITRGKLFSCTTSKLIWNRS